jgi:hypothetical protein
MAFIYNSLDQGWSVKKRDGKYIFQKSHNGKREIFRRIMENAKSSKTII